MRPIVLHGRPWHQRHTDPDVQRYLNDEPVEACPPSAEYRLRKFVWRNKGPVLAVSIVALALVGGIIGTTWGLVRAELARQAEAQQRQIAQTKEQEAVAAAEQERQAKRREAEQRAIAETRREGADAQPPRSRPRHGGLTPRRSPNPSVQASCRTV